jgi:hypothetical protein
MCHPASPLSIYNLATVTRKSFISARGHSGFSAGSGLSRSQAHFSASAVSSSPSSICVTYLPSTGKNLYPWNEPHVATYSPLAAACGETVTDRGVDGRGHVIARARVPDERTLQRGHVLRRSDSRSGEGCAQ